MAKAVGHIRAVVSRILLIGLSIQIILGLFWMCCSFDGVQEFAETAYYLRISESLLCDEYTGILYPFILMLAGWAEKLTSIPREPMLYLLQVVIAFIAGVRFVGMGTGGDRGRKLWKVWGSLALMTFPMTMQCHMAILPNSLAFSCFLLMVSDVFAKKKKKYFPIYWLFAALLMPEYLYFGLCLVLLRLVFQLAEVWKTKDKDAGRKWVSSLIVVLVSVGIIIGANVMTHTPGSQGKVQSSVEAAWFRRNVWTSLADYYFYWPQEVKDAFSQEEIAAVQAEPGNMILLLQPGAEAALGKEEAKAWFGEFGTFVLKANYRRILPETAMDAVGYLFPTVIHNMLLGGRGYASCSPRNYEIMRQDHPLLTHYYMDYCSWWFVAGTVLATVMWCSGKRHRRSRTDKIEAGNAAVSFFDGNRMCMGTCCIIAGVMVLWYTLSQSGLWDYKNVLFTGCLWMVCFVNAQAGEMFGQLEDTSSNTGDEEGA